MESNSKLVGFINAVGAVIKSGMVVAGWLKTICENLIQSSKIERPPTENDIYTRCA